MAVAAALSTWAPEATSQGMPSMKMGGSHSEKGAYVLHVGTVAPEGVMYHKYVMRALRESEERSAGRLRFVMHAGGSAGDEPEVAKKILDGRLDGGGISINGAQRLEPETMILTLPFFYESEEEYEYVRDRLLPYLTERLNARGVVLLGFIERGGPIQLFSTQEHGSVRELIENASWWSWQGDQSMPLFFSGVGAGAIVPTDLDGLTQGLRKGSITAFRTAVADTVILGWYPWVKAIYKFDLAQEFGIVVMNRRSFERLPADLQGVIRRVYEELLPDINKKIRRDEEIAMVGLYKRGVKVIHPSKEDRNWLSRNKEAIWDAYQKEFFPRGLLDRVIALREEYRRSKIE
ncbi:MAG: TRAP transporter substrate-binding protein DctP [Nitrospirae bacterium]|nr:TRAP transporter substrate-binding protein DctP [Nitrospirota bacterium]